MVLFCRITNSHPTTSALILATTPILTSFLAAIFLKEKITIRMLMGSILAITGIYYVVTTDNPSSLHFDKVYCGLS